MRIYSENIKQNFRALVFSLILLFFVFLNSFLAFSDDININMTYGYQNTAKAGRFLPVKLDLENTTDETFAGYISIYVAESESNLYEHRYQVTVEANSKSSINLTLAVGSGVSQLYAVATRMMGKVLGSRELV